MLCWGEVVQVEVTQNNGGGAGGAGGGGTGAVWSGGQTAVELTLVVEVEEVLIQALIQQQEVAGGSGK